MGDKTDENDEIASAPETASTAPTDAPATAVADHVEQAAETAQNVAQESGVEGWNVVATELRGLRSDIKKLMKTRDASVAAEPTAVEPTIEIEEPTPPARMVRRNGRKVKR